MFDAVFFSLFCLGGGTGGVAIESLSRPMIPGDGGGVLYSSLRFNFFAGFRWSFGTVKTGKTSSPDKIICMIN